MACNCGKSAKKVTSVRKTTTASGRKEVLSTSPNTTRSANSVRRIIKRRAR